jgi:Raf kinase inhibitor-like YbhB/YbcL family protein
MLNSYWRARLVSVLLASVVGSVMAFAQLTTPGASLAIERPETRAEGTLIVTSTALAPRKPLPKRYADYGEGFSPPLAWADVPSAARSIVVIMEDPDAKSHKPFVHWILYNLPTKLAALPESVPMLPRLPIFEGALQGRNTRGTIGYFGPRPPIGDPPHHYHFEVFALDTLLDLQPGADREAVLGAMQGHVLARGELVATFEQRRLESD